MRFVKVGVFYCVEHHGVANEDERECDFSYGEPGACRFRVLGYRSHATPDRKRRVPASGRGPE